MSGLLEWRLPGDHIEEDYPSGEDIRLAGLVGHLEVDLGAHVVDGAHKCL